MVDNKMEKWIGFNTITPFLIDKELKELNQMKTWDISKFYELFSPEKAIEYRCNFYNLRVFDGGIFTLKFDNTILGMGPEGDAEQLKELLKINNYLNSIQLLFVSSFLKKLRLQGPMEYYEINSKNCLRLMYKRNKLIGPIRCKGEKGVGDTGVVDESFYNNMLTSSISIEKIILDELNHDLENVSKDYKNIEILSEINKSLSEYKIMNFSSSILLSWIIIEKFLNIFLTNILVDTQKKKIINRAFRDDLEGDTNFTASLKSKILKIFNTYDMDVFKGINEVRSQRNTIMHEMHRKQKIDASAESKICRAAFDVITNFLKNYMDLSLEFDTSSGYSL